MAMGCFARHVGFTFPKIFSGGSVENRVEVAQEERGKPVGGFITRRKARKDKVGMEQ